LEDFDIREKVGEGSFSQVFKAIRKLDGLTYAIKKVDMASLN
jgi:serine/threonine protein kinase